MYATTRKAPRSPRGLAAPRGGRPKVFSDAVRITLLVERTDAEDLRRFAAWRSSTEGRNVSQGAAVMDALGQDRRYRAWKRVASSTGAAE